LVAHRPAGRACQKSLGKAADPTLEAIRIVTEEAVLLMKEAQTVHDTHVTLSESG
jgi:hypothetical protein